MTEAPSKRLEFRYSFADGYRIAPTNGALGGPTSKGDFRIEFFVEAPLVRPAESYELRADGTLGPRLDPPSDALIERRITTGILMSISEVRKLAVWILEKTERVLDVEADAATSSDDSASASGEA